MIFFERQRIYDQPEEFVPGGVPEGYYEVPFGQPVVRKEGRDLTMLTIGATLYRVMKAARQLEKKFGLSCEVIDARSLVPFDYQTGTQQRSGPHSHRARLFIRDGQLGRIVSARMGFHRNIMPGFGRPPDQTPPAELDWDMFLGPVPMRPYNPNRGIYHFCWFWDYSGGQITNLGAHSLDVVHWFLNLQGPKAVYSTGGRHFLDDNCETPDVQDAIIEYPGFAAAISIRECSRGRDSEFSEFLWDQRFAQHLARFLLIHAALPGMREKRSGRIVNIVSVAGKRVMPIAGLPYCTSKFALSTLGTFVNLEECEKNGIRVTNIYPGEANTPLVDKRPVPPPPEKRAKMLQPEDIAACVAVVAKLPPRAVVQELVIAPAHMLID